MNILLNEIKENNQDFEWYPTTKEIIQRICNDIKDRHIGLLDIGAGNGNVFKLFDEISSDIISEKYAIEKSNILINNMDKDIFIIGTDFNEQTLIDKKVDIIFCNPPYSEFEQWTEKIILEANCNFIYLVIPERWKENVLIKNAIKKREVEYEILGSFSFEDSEFRKARSNVNIVKINCDNRNSNDPFDIWFDSAFIFNADKTEKNNYKEKETSKDKIHSVIKSNNIVASLVKLYTEDLEKLHNNYRAVEKLDYSILQELNINIRSLKEGLKLKIEGLKNLYWEELFNNLKTITDRLTFNSRKNLLKRLTDNTSIDFTAKNIYAIVIWVVKNTNYYLDKQLLDVYFEMTSKENIVGYKSNKRFLTDEWRYLKTWDFNRQKNELTNYKLDYMLVFERYNNFCTDKYGFGSYNYPNGLKKETHEYINDILTIAKNLGFDINESTMEVGQWKSKTKKDFSFGSDNKLFAEIRAYKNGNIHCKFVPEFIKQLNIEAGRLNGWLKTPKEANEELEINDAEKYFKRNLQFLPSDTKLLLDYTK